MKKLFSAVLGIILFSLAGLAIYKQLHHIHYHDIYPALQAISDRQIGAALLCALLSYLMLTGYDYLAIKYIGKNLTYSKTAFISFLTYAIGNNTGVGTLGTGAIRFRYYTSMGFSAFEIGQIIGFCGLTFWIGVMFLGGVELVWQPAYFPQIPWLNEISANFLGPVFLGIVALYLAICMSVKRVLVIRGHAVRLPPLSFAIWQILISGLDWTFASLTLFVLLPAGAVSYSHFLTVFLVAQTAGILSHVPAGLGILEAVVIALLSDQIPSPQLIGSLIIFRIVYYSLPLGAALIGLLFSESQTLRHRSLEYAKRLQPLTNLIPAILSFQVFISGIVLILSGVTPSVHERIRILREMLPLAFVETSHFFGSLVGLLLLFLAFGLLRRQKSAFYFTQIILAAGIVFSLLKGLDYEEATFLGATWVILILGRSHFYRLTKIWDVRLNSEWIFLISATLAVSVWTLFFAYKRVEYTNDLWWQIEFARDAPRSLRATLGVAVTAVLYLAWQFLKPLKKIEVSTPEDLEHARQILATSDRSNAFLALTGDKSFIFSESGRSFIMYGVQGRSWVSMGDPIGPKDDWPEILWRFRELADIHDGKPVFYQVRPENLEQYLDLGMTFFKLGEEAMVSLDKFSLEGAKQKEHRNRFNKFEKEGAVFAVIAAPLTDEFLHKIHAVSGNWLQTKNTREKSFSMGAFRPPYLRGCDCAVIMRDNEIVAFANIWRTADKNELSVDLMRYREGAPAGAMDYLFLKLMLWGKENGYRWFNLGMAPMSGLSEHPLTSRWNKLGGLLFRHGENFYNFEGLRSYKEKYHPQWEPRYLASLGGLTLPLVFLDIANLISGKKTKVRSQ